MAEKNTISRSKSFQYPENPLVVVESACNKIHRPEPIRQNIPIQCKVFFLSLNLKFALLYLTQFLSNSTVLSSTHSKIRRENCNVRSKRKHFQCQWGKLYSSSTEHFREKWEIREEFLTANQRGRKRYCKLPRPQLSQNPWENCTST